MEKDEFTVLTKKYKDTIYKLAYTYLKNSFDAEDVTQNVLFNIYKINKKFDSDEHLKFYIIRCTINECKKIWRLHWNKNVDIDEITVSSEIQNESELDLMNAIMKLNKKQRVVIDLYYVEGYKIEEISKILKIPKGTVGTRLSEAKENLKRYLEGDEENE